MRTIRRLYLYAVAFISLMVITWGLIGLARSAFAGDEISKDVSNLAGALALIFVGIPVFLLHWWLAQRGANQDEEERASYIRALFLYGALLATLIPITQNLMALINRGLFTLFDLSDNGAIFGVDQTWSDNLIAMLMNSLIAAYIFSMLRKDWAAKPSGNAFADTRRFYRYIWVIYGLMLMLAGAAQTLLYIFDTLEDTALASQTTLANGLTLILVGIPIWVYSWRIVQKSITESTERESLLRAVILFLVSMIGLAVTLLSCGAILSTLLQAILGEPFRFASLMGALRDPVSSALPFGIVWAYFSYVRRQDMAAVSHARQLNSIQQIYTCLSAFFGLGAFFIGLQQLAFFIIGFSVDPSVWDDTLRETLSWAIANIVFGLPLWFLNWRKVNRQPPSNEKNLNPSQNSLTRKIYLYLVLFIGVMGLMMSAGVLIYQILQALLGDPDDNLGQIALELISLLILFSLFTGYHWLVLRSDGRLSATLQAEQHAAFPILVLVSELGVVSQMLVATLSKEAPTMPVAVHVIEQGVPDEALSDARAVILPANIATNSGEAIRLWLQNFAGVRFVIPAALQGWVWVSTNGTPLEILVRQTAQMVKNLAEGDDKTQVRSLSPRLIFASIVSAVFGLALLLIAISILIDVLS